MPLAFDLGYTSVTLVLLFMNAFQLWYWSKQNQALVDKVMSRNYAEYVQLNSYRDKLPQESQVPEEPDETADVLRELNGKFGL